MKSEDEPVTENESVIRLIWGEFLRPGERAPMLSVSFRPRDDETDGISVYRLACLKDPTEARLAMAPEKRDRYAIAVIPMAELTALGLSVLPSKNDLVRGHAVIPEMNIAALKANRRYWKDIELKLVDIAMRNLLPPIEPPP